jgi:hypothetical protein
MIPLKHIIMNEYIFHEESDEVFAYSLQAAGDAACGLKKRKSKIYRRSWP